MIGRIISFALPTSFIGYVGISYVSRSSQKEEKYKIIEQNEVFEKREYGDGLKAQISLLACSHAEALKRGKEQLDGFFEYLIISKY